MLFIFILLLCTSIAIGADKAPAIKELTEEQLKTAQLNGEEYFEALSFDYYLDSSTQQKKLDLVLKNCEKEGINSSTVKLYALQAANRHAIDKTNTCNYRQKVAKIALNLFNSSEEFRKKAEAAQIFPAEPAAELGQFETASYPGPDPIDIAHLTRENGPLSTRDTERGLIIFRSK